MTNPARSDDGDRHQSSVAHGLFHELRRSDHPRILLAEDDPEMKKLLSHRLRRDGCLVLELPDGRQLLAAVAAELLHLDDGHPIDLIISDVRMPGPSGLQILTAVRRSNWHVPFILITAFGSPELRTEARRLGASATFDKPFDLDDLMTAVAILVPA
jgi:CheY-like chemotaxis protein